MRDELLDSIPAPTAEDMLRVWRADHCVQDSSAGLYLQWISFAAGNGPRRLLSFNFVGVPTGERLPRVGNAQRADVGLGWRWAKSGCERVQQRTGWLVGDWV